MDLTKKNCVPCEMGTPPMKREDAEKSLREVEGWEIADENSKLKILKKFKFDSYMEGINFVSKIAKLAEVEDHHPHLEVGWRRVTVNFTTHNIGGLSENDFIMAAKVDKIPV